MLTMVSASISAAALETINIDYFPRDYTCLHKLLIFMQIDRNRLSDRATCSYRQGEAS